MRSRKWTFVSGTFGLALLAASAPSCDSSSGSNGGDGGNNPGSDGGRADSGPVGVDEAGVPIGQPATVDPNPTNPKDDSGKDLGWQDAPLMSGVAAIMNRDSAIITVPVVDGAHDYRVMTVPSGVDVSVDGDKEI